MKAWVIESDTGLRIGMVTAINDGKPMLALVVPDGREMKFARSKDAFAMLMYLKERGQAHDLLELRAVETQLEEWE